MIFSHEVGQKQYFLAVSITVELGLVDMQSKLLVCKS